MNILNVSNLTKKFGSFTAVDDISFQLKEGEILGILGPNGAGKTTTLQMILGLSTPTAGKVEYFGKELNKHRTEILEQVNFSSAYTRLPKNLKVKENMKFVSYLYNIKNRKARVEKIAKIFQLEEIWDRSVRNLSAGQSARLNLAKAFINFPKVLLLDEPTASLDPEVADFVRTFLENERKEFQVSIIITSHNMAEVEELCDRVIFINHGKILANDTPANLAKTIETSHLKLLVSKDSQKNFSIFCEKNKLVCRQEGNYQYVDIKEKQISKFLQDLALAKVTYDEISIVSPTLEDYFLENARKT